MGMKKALAGFLVFLLLSNLFLPAGKIGSCPVLAEGFAGETEQNGEFYEPSYYDYLVRNGYDNEISRSEIIIDITRYKKTDDMQAILDDDGISTGDRGIIEWEFTVKDAGFYNIQVSYLPLKGTNLSIERKIYIDGEILFKGMEQVVLSRIWKNSEDGRIISKNRNEIRPVAVEEPEWRTVFICDSQKRSLEPYVFYFSEGKHTIAFESIKEPVKIGEIVLKAAPEPKPYEEVIGCLKEKYPEYEGENIVCQAERVDGNTVGIKKSSPSIGVSTDYSSPNTVPYHPYKIVFNTMGGNNWRTAGDFIIWEVEVPEEGLYQLSFRGRQNINRGVKSYRELRINGEVPFKEAQKIGFEFSGEFKNYVCGDEKGHYLFYLKKGRNTISLEVVLGDFGRPLTVVEQCLFELNEIYRKTVQITGLVPDRFIDYEIDKKIPEFKEKLKDISVRLKEVVEELVRISGEKGEKTAIIEKMAVQAEELAQKPENVINELTTFKGNISALGTWIISISEMPLEIDSFTLSKAGAKLPKAEPNAFVKFYYELVRFFSTFFVDDAKLTTDAKISRDAVKVWISSGRDQAQIIRNLIDDSYTPYSDIPINLELIPNDVILPATLAGNGPDVVLNIPQSTVINFAVRNALTDLTRFEDFSQQSARFYSSALKPVTHQDGIYGLPEQQWFMMMFYRNDILGELGLEPPKTWDEMKKIIPVLHMNNYDVYIPGASIFTSLVYQYGGDVYQGEGKDYGIASGLIGEDAMLAFHQLTEFFTSYKLPVTADFSNRFRTGEMPIGIAPYTTYNQLEIFAPEIRGLWSFAPVPGIADADGNINNTVVSDTTQCIMMSSARNKQNAWDFMKWWLSDDTQMRYANTLEAVMGTSARYATANKDLIMRLPWPRKHAEQLMQQLEATEGVPEVPGGYMTGRMIDYAFKAVVTNGQNPREALYLNIKAIDKELSKKRREFNLSYLE